MGRLFGVHRRPAPLDQVILICAPAVITSIVLYGLYYYLQGAWQLLAVAGGSGAALAGIGLSLFLSRRRHPTAAARVLLLSMLVVLGVVPLFVAGLTHYIIATAALLILVVGAEILPGRYRIWLATAMLFGLATLLIEWQAPLPRYMPGPSGLRGLYMLGASTTFLAVVLWHTTLGPLPAFTSIRTRLLITSVVLVCFTGGAVSYFSTVVLRHQEQDDAIAWLSAVTSRKEGQIDSWTDHMQMSLALFARHSAPQLLTVLAPRAEEHAGYHDALQHLHADLMDTFVLTHVYDALYVVDTRGHTALAAGAADVAPLDVTCAGQPDGPCIKPPRYYPSLGRMAVVAVQPVHDQNGQLIGTVAGYASMEALYTIVDEPDSLSEIGVTYLLGADHTVLLPVGTMQALPAAVQPLALDAQGAGSEPHGREGDVFFYEDSHGVPLVGVYRWLPKLQVALLAEQTQAEAFQSSKALIDVHLGVTLILLATAAVTALYMVRSITAPLSELSATAEKIADGALDLTAEVRHDDEIGALARAFNHMTARLRHARDQLEQRVRQRTEELAQANAELQSENAVRMQTEQAVQRERNKLKSILDTIEDGVYIVSRRYTTEYANPTLEREFGPINGRTCYEHMYGRTEPCPWCPNEQVWQGVSVRREETRKNGTIYEVYDTPLQNADGSVSKLAIFHDVTAHKRAQEEILQRNHELAILSRQLVEIQERERHHISRELHDETSQALTSLMLRLGMLERDLQHGVAAAHRVAELKHMLEEVLTGLHRLATDLRPPSLDHIGLVAALRQYAERVAAQYGLVVDFGAIGLDEKRLPQELEIAIYRIVQEAVANVVRHAQATHVDVIVERRPDRVRVIVEDNGCGFEMAAVSCERLGMLGMRERAEMVGGHLAIDSARGAGTTVVMEAPYDGSYPDRG